MEPLLLISSPQMRDDSFTRTVVFVWYHDEEGAVGVVLNRQLDHPLSDVLEEADVDDYDGAVVLWGGPVDGGQGTVVTRAGLDDADGWPLREGLSVTRNLTALLRLVDARADLLLCLGYAGWGAGQLDRELERGDWLYTDATDALLFETPREALYETALATLGLTPSTVLMTPIES